VVWVGHPKVGSTISGEFALGQVGNHETCHGFVACPSQAGLPKPAGPAFADQAETDQAWTHQGRDEEQPMKKLTFGALMILTVTATASAAMAQDVAAGKSSFNKCLACHAIGEGAKNKVGPELNGIDGRKSGTAPDYNYSDANKNSGITWNEALFKEYIKDPKAKIPGTKMAFAGIKNETEINNLWTFVSQFDKDGKIKQ
jgi:cytochrome c